MIREKIMMIMAGCIVIGLMIISIQNQIIKREQARIKSLESDVATLIRGIALTDSLRKANADLDRFQAEIREDLVDADGYDDPLSDDLIGIHQRLQSNPTGTGRPVE